MRLEICGKEVELKIGFKAFLLYEQITEKSYSPESLSDIIYFFFAVVYSSDKSKSITFEMFIEWLDENPKAMDDFTRLVNEYNTRNSDIEKAPEKEVTKEEVDDIKKN